MWNNKVNPSNMNPKFPQKMTKDLNHRSIRNGVLKWSCDGASCITKFYRILPSDDNGDENLSLKSSPKSGSKLPPLYRSWENGNSTYASSRSKSVKSFKDSIGTPDICQLITKEWDLPNDIELIVWLVGPLKDKEPPDDTKRKNKDDVSVDDDNPLQPNKREIQKLTEQIIKITADTESWLFVQANDTDLFDYVEDAMDKHELVTWNKPAHVIGVTFWPYDDLDMCDEVEFCKRDKKEHYTIMYNHTNKKRGELSPSIKQHIFLDYRTVDFQNLMTENVKTMDLKDVFQCAIVINGDEGTLTVLRRKMENHIPIILVQGSGGLTDKLIDIKNNNSMYRDSGYSDIINYDYLEVLSDKDQSNEACIGERVLLAIQNAYRSTMDMTTTTPKYMRKVHFYKLCTELDKFDVLQNDTNFNWKEMKLKENPWLTRIIFEAVKQGQVDFVKFFIEENFDMKSAFSQQKLHELYQTKPEYPSKLSQVASYVNKLLGGSYHMSCPKLMKEEEEGRSYHQELYSHEKNKTALRDLFIWSVLAKKLELSKCLWSYLDHQTAAAMFAFGVAKAMLTSTKISKSGNRSDKIILKDYMKEFTNLACETINSSFMKDEEKTFDLLRLQMSKWGQTSCVRLALDSHNKEFLSTPACQQLCNRLWWLGQEVDMLSNQQGLQHRSEQKSSCGPCSCCGRIKYLFTPHVMFWLHFLGLIIFLFFYGWLLVSELDMSSFSWLEWLVWSWVIVYILEGLRLKIAYINKRIKVKNLSSKERPSKCDKLKSLCKQSYSKVLRKSNLPEWINLLSYVLFLLAWSFRCAAYYSPSLRDQLGGTASILFSLDYVIFSFRVFEFFYVSKFLGLLVAMITEMAITLFKFLIIVFVFFVAFAVASESVIYPQKDLRGPGLFYLFRIAYWSMFGEHFLSEIEASNSPNECTREPSIYNTYTELRCPTDVGRYYVPILMAVYVMVTNILLFNLVIAKFNSTIDKIEKQAELVWNYHQFKTTLVFSKGVLLPPPFLLLSVFIYLTKSSNDICVKKVKEKHMRKKLLRLEKMSIEEFNNKNKSQQSTTTERNEKDSCVSRKPERNISLELLGLKKENVPENGDSIFWAIIVQADNVITPEKLREQVCWYIKENLEDNEWIDGDLFDGWEDVLKETGRWDKRLKGFVLQSVANILQRDIVIFTTDKTCPLKVISTTERVLEDEVKETYIALYYEHKNEHYAALLPRKDEKDGNRLERTFLHLNDCLAQLNLKRDSDTDKAETNVFYAASKWLTKCPVEAPDMLESLVASYIKNHGLSKVKNRAESHDDQSSVSGDVINGKRRSAANESLKIKSLAEMMETNVVIVSNQKSQALSLVSPRNRSKQLVYRKVVFCATFMHSGKVDYYHVTQSDDSNCDENRWRKDKPSQGLLDTRLKRMGFEKLSKSNTDMFTAIADQDPMTSIDDLKETVMKELVINPKIYKEKSKSDQDDWTKDLDVFLTDHSINDKFVDTVARATATVLGKNILVVLSDPTCPFYLVSPTNKSTSETVYLARMQHGKAGAYCALSPKSTVSGFNKKSGHDKLRRSGTKKRKMSTRSSGKTFDAAELRQKVCEHFEKNAPNYQKRFGISTEDWNEELNILSKSGCWDVSLGDLVPHALSKVLGRRLVILHDEQERFADELYPDDAPIYLVRQQDHFHAAVEKNLSDSESFGDQDVPISSKLKTMLAEKGLQLIPIEPDGNCIFEAVAIQL